MRKNNWIRIALGIAVTGIAVTGCKSLRNSAYNSQVTEFKMTWEGRERLYLVHLPPAEKMNRPLPVLFNIHGGGGTALGNIGLTFGRFNELADRDGFIVVYPEAVDKNWNDGRQSDKVTAWREHIDDVGFIAAIIDGLKGRYAVDADRIFTSGMSNGGFMSSRLLCDRADLFRGGAVLTATLSAEYLPECNPSKPVAVMIMNGTADKIVPYEGGQVKVLGQSRGEILPTGDYIRFWQEKNGCTQKRPSVNLPDKENDGTTVTVQEFGGCAGQGALVFYRINGGGHTWPGGRQYLGEGLIGKTSKDIVACDVIWDFFKNL